MTHRRLSLPTACLGFLLTSIFSQFGQSQDAVFRIKPGGGNTRLTGKITSVSPEGVTIGDKQVPANLVHRISVGKEPPAINRMRERLRDGQYESCLAGLDKITNLPDEILLKQEIDFMRAYATAQLALKQGSITARDAGTIVGKFLSDHPDSFHRYPMLEQYGRLIYAFGRPKAAAVEFQKLTTASWDEMRLKGFWLHGRMMDLIESSDAAEADFRRILSDSSSGAIASQYKSLAQCGIAKLQGRAGQGDRAVEQLRKLLKQSSNDDPLLRANIYNALGVVYLQSGQLKAARTAFLHSPLLFNGQSDQTAESLYYLVKLWPQLNQDARGNEAREELKSKFRNSYWAGIVDKN